MGVLVWLALLWVVVIPFLVVLSAVVAAPRIRSRFDAKIGNGTVRTGAADALAGAPPASVG